MAQSSSHESTSKAPENSPKVWELLIASQAKPFPYSPLAAAIYINNAYKQKREVPPILIVAQPVAYFNPGASTAQLVKKDTDAVTVTETPVICKTLASHFEVLGLSVQDRDEKILGSLCNALVALHSGDRHEITEFLVFINKAMAYSMHPLGHKFTIIDILIWGLIKEDPQTMADTFSGKYPEIERWYKEFMEPQDLVHQVGDFIRDLNTYTASLMKKPKVKKTTPGFKLEGAEQGKVVTRFPPEPSGYLHIGHAKAAILNATAAADYDGTLILRFDDTNPAKESIEFQESQLADLETLGITPDKVTFTSNYFQEIEDKCVQLLKEGKAYCDDTPQEQMRKERMDGIESKSRNRPVEDNVRIFNEMKNYTEEGRQFCVRAKISIDAKNKALRDPVIYRCNNTVHHRTGSKFKMYPTYDFACPVVDSMEGVTHALRTLEYKDRDAQYAWMLKALGMRPVRIIGFSRLNFVRTVLSKRKLQWFVDQKIVSGWDDPRFPTVRGVMRRGCVIEALRKFIISQGPSKNINNLEWASFWAENKKAIDPVAKRYACVNKGNCVPIKLCGPETPEEPHVRDLPCHKKNPDLGKKKVWYSSEILIDQDDARTFKQNEEITLMDWGNAIIREIHYESSGAIITSLNAELHLDGDFKKTDKKITWIANVASSLTPCVLVTFDHLLTKDKLEEDDKLEDFVNRDSVSKVDVFGDSNMKTLQAGSIVQFERKGYFRLDRAYNVETGEPAEFFLIPDGKTVNRYGVKA